MNIEGGIHMSKILARHVFGMDLPQFSGDVKE
jgi:hypothetical protein